MNKARCCAYVKFSSNIFSNAARVFCRAIWENRGNAWHISLSWNVKYFIKLYRAKRGNYQTWHYWHWRARRKTKWDSILRLFFYRWERRIALKILVIPPFARRASQFLTHTLFPTTTLCLISRIPAKRDVCQIVNF